MLRFLIVRIFPSFSVPLDGEKLIGKNSGLVLLSFARSPTHAADILLDKGFSSA